MKPKKYTTEILKRFVDGIYTRDDAHSIFHFCRTHERADVDNMMGDVWASLNEEKGSEQNQEEYKKEARQLLGRIRKQEKRISLAPLLKYVALLAILCTVGWTGYLLTKRAGLENLTYTEIRVKNGEHKEVQLPDGTNVILNAGTVMKYPDRFMSNQRSIEINGEAFFEVTPDAERPFIIQTKNAAIRVLGTSFNVKAYDTDEQLMVSVQTGKVQVDMPEAMMRLLPNEQLIFNHCNGDIRKKQEDINRPISWIYGNLYFNKTPIQSVVKDLERMYNCTIEFSPGIIYNEYVYGEHENRSLLSVLKSIQYSTGIKYRKEGDKILLYK